MKDQAEQRLNELLEQLKRERDQLKVRTHLLKAELMQEWEEVEQKWQNIESRMQRLRASAVESAEGVGAATDLLADEIRNAYQRFRKTLDQ